MQDIQAAEFGSCFSNRSKNGKLFKNLLSTEPFVVPFCPSLRFFVEHFWAQLGNLSREPYRKFGQIWSRQCNAAEVLQSLRQDPNTSQMDHVFWIGHSSILLCLKSGTNILFDPIFSKRCSPLSFIGPARCYPPGTTIEHLPPIHIVTISHNHYDHLDEKSLRSIYRRNPDVIFVVPLRMDTHLTQWGIPKSSIISMDWQDEILLRDVAIGCTPAQHYGRRGLFDSNQVLWCGWCIGWQATDLVRSSPATTADGALDPVRCSAAVGSSLRVMDWSKAKVFYFPGDTAFNKCVFDIIHAQYDHISMAAIPIGAYKPRWFLSKQHIDPAFAVQIFKILNVTKAFAVHWATFQLGNDALDDPQKDLKAALDAEDVSEDDFALIPIGEHLSF
ncbi:unnamed protein product [Phytomonas sp. EM1]|nr:unnamed protein product [Phytomonas sp. EM1]|eukprot:CCW64070.1 unnamed protein product [Phytomonas sp. isolate EM1]